MNVPYHLARLEGHVTRSIYRAALPTFAHRAIRIERELAFDVFSYSGESSLPEQVVSIRSFLTHAGRPKQFTVVSDGSYTSTSIALLEKIDNCVRVETEALPLPADLPEQVQSHLANHFTGRQLALIMSLPANGPSLYTDSDVLFFPEAKLLADLAHNDSVSAYYLADYQFSGDERLIRNISEKAQPVNMGFLFLFRKLDWSSGVERLQALKGAPNFFTTQTLVHLCLHANGAAAFDRTKFILEANDQFIYRDCYSSDSIAARHYVNPVRHKFWATVARPTFQ